MSSAASSVANQLVDRAVVEFEILVFLQSQKQVQPELVGLIDQIQDSLELQRYAQYTSLLEEYLDQVLAAAPQPGQPGTVEQALNLFENVILPSSAWINRNKAARMSVTVSQRQPTKQDSLAVLQQLQAVRGGVKSHMEASAAVDIEVGELLWHEYSAVIASNPGVDSAKATRAETLAEELKDELDSVYEVINEMSEVGAGLRKQFKALKSQFTSATGRSIGPKVRSQYSKQGAALAEKQQRVKCEGDQISVKNVVAGSQPIQTLDNAALRSVWAQDLSHAEFPLEVCFNHPAAFQLTSTPGLRLIHAGALSELDLTGNKLQQLKQSELQRFFMLNTLKVSSNLLTGVDLFFERLTSLDLSGNLLSEFPDLNGCPMLATVNLGKNNISNTSWQLTVSGTKLLESLDLSDNAIAWTASNLTPNISLLSGLKSFTTLDMSGNPISAKYFRVYAAAVCPTLITLNGEGVTAKEREDGLNNDRYGWRKRVMPKAKEYPVAKEVVDMHDTRAARLSQPSSAVMANRKAEQKRKALELAAREEEEKLAKSLTSLSGLGDGGIQRGEAGTDDALSMLDKHFATHVEEPGYYTNRTLAHVELDTTREISLDEREKQSDLMQEVDNFTSPTVAADVSPGRVTPSAAADDSSAAAAAVSVSPNSASLEEDREDRAETASLHRVQSPTKPSSVPRLETEKTNRDVKKHERPQATPAPVTVAVAPNAQSDDVDSDDSSDLSSHRNVPNSASASTRSKSAGPRRKLGRGPTGADYASKYGEKSILSKLNKTKSLIPYAVMEEPLSSERSDRSGGSSSRTKIGRSGFVSGSSGAGGLNIYGASNISDAGKQKEMEMMMSNSESLLGFYKHENQHRQYQFEKQRKRAFVRQTCFGLYRAAAHRLGVGFSAWMLILIAGKRSRVVITAQLLGQAVGTKMKFKELMLLYRRKAKAKGWNWWKMFMLTVQKGRAADQQAAARAMDMLQQASTRLKIVGMRYWRRACYDHEMQKTMAKMEDYEKRVRMLEKEKGTLSALMSGWKQSSLDADTMFQKEVAGFKANKIMQLKKRRLIRSANNVFVSLAWSVTYATKARRYFVRVKDHVKHLMQWAMQYWQYLAALDADINDMFMRNRMWKPWCRWVKEDKRSNKINNVIGRKAVRENKTARDEVFVWWKRHAWRVVQHHVAKQTAGGLQEKFLWDHAKSSLTFWRQWKRRRLRMQQMLMKIKRNRLIVSGKKYFIAILRYSHLNLEGQRVRYKIFNGSCGMALRSMQTAFNLMREQLVFHHALVLTKEFVREQEKERLRPEMEKNRRRIKAGTVFSKADEKKRVSVQEDSEGNMCVLYMGKQLRVTWIGPPSPEFKSGLPIKFVDPAVQGTVTLGNGREFENPSKQDDVDETVSNG